jgi:hydrogenase maturation protein HypF
MLTSLPFDRANTAMTRFPMCRTCAAEYADPADRRFHAQGNCCPACGPRLVAHDGRQPRATRDEALRLAVGVLADGGIVALKGIGGFHLCCDATSDRALVELRRRKRRDAKPFAVMLPPGEGRALAGVLPPAATTALLSAERPILVIERDRIAAAGLTALSGHVAPHAPGIGVFLPYSGVHHLLIGDLDRPLVMTSGNRSDEPMACDDEQAFEALGSIADLFLTHDRAIVRRCDDAVARAAGDRLMPMRVGRGQAPLPLALAEASPQPVLGTGVDLKNTVCFVSGARAHLSAHVGTLDSPAARHSLTLSVAQLERLLAIEPALIVHDRHPDLGASLLVERYPDAERASVQHHHAHVLSCLAEHGCRGPAIGVAFDGAGLGDDGAVWGGEFLLVDGVRAERVAHLAYVPLPGGDAAVREPWRMALAHLRAAGGAAATARRDAIAARVGAHKAAAVAQLVARGTCAPPTSSVGRLFDAVAALLDLCSVATFEGQAAMALEAAATEAGSCRYRFELDTSPACWTVDAAPVIAAIAADVEARRPAGQIAAAFHDALAEAVADTVGRLASRSGVRTIALTGGVFQNAKLAPAAAAALAARSLDVLEHRRVPCNDGGLSLGQALFGVRLLRQRRERM